MYKCEMCDSIFSEPESKSYCYEDYCGVRSQFQNWNFGHYDVCPYCGSEDINSYWEEELDEYGYEDE